MVVAVQVAVVVGVSVSRANIPDFDIPQAEKAPKIMMMEIAPPTNNQNRPDRFGGAGFAADAGGAVDGTGFWAGVGEGLACCTGLCWAPLRSTAWGGGVTGFSTPGGGVAGAAAPTAPAFTRV